MMIDINDEEVVEAFDKALTEMAEINHMVRQMYLPWTSLPKRFRKQLMEDFVNNLGDKSNE